MDDHEINAEACMDVRNPNDKFEFDVFGLVVPNERMILYVFKMYTGEANWRFRSIAENGRFTIAMLSLNPMQANVLHRFLSLWRSGQRISALTFNATSPRIPHPYVSLKMTDVKVSRIARTQGESTGDYYYLVSLETKPRSGVVTPGN